MKRPNTPSSSSANNKKSSISQKSARNAIKKSARNAVKNQEKRSQQKKYLDEKLRMKREEHNTKIKAYAEH